MIRLLLVCIYVVFSFSAFAQENSRKKVGVVLSGGGAKGAAHVKALKVIEEAGIPIDYIAGTSIGSLVGGMYASGYNADQIDSIMHSLDWNKFLMDLSDRTSQSMADKERRDKYMLTARFDKSPFEIIEGGLLKGNNVSKLLTEITADTPDSINYNTLKIPFACVATNVVTGEEVDLQSGVLAESMRASMAIPTVFTPVVKGDMVLTDGGTSNNYPVDLVRRMGADYVIGVDLAGDMHTAEQLNMPQTVALQLIALLCQNKHDENVANTDVYIRVNVKGYSSSSFNNKAIDSLMVRGETAARAKWDELIALRNKLGLTEPVKAPEARPMPENMYDVVPSPVIYSSNERNSFVGVGARFDNEELASVILGGKYELNKKSRLNVGLDVRLGRQINAELYSSVNISKMWSTQLSYNFKYNDFNLYDKGERASEELNRGHIVQLGFVYNWQKNLKVLLGTRFSYYNFEESLVHKDYLEWTEDMGDERGLSYFARVTFDNRDAKANASHGMFWTLGYELFTDNFTTFEGGSPIMIYDGRFSISLPLSRSTTLVPSVAGRWMPNNDYFTIENCIGGVNKDGHYMSQQMSFAGVNYLQMMKNNLFVAGLTLRQFLTTNNYLFLVGNYGRHSNKPFNVKDSTHMYGAALGYGYRTSIGPAEFNINWSDVTKKVGFSINLGYVF